MNRTLPALLALALLATSCTKDTERQLRIRVAGDRFGVTVDGPTTLATEATLAWETTLAAEPGTTVAIRACRLPTDWITTPDSTYLGDTLNVPVGILVYLGGAQLADAWATTTGGQECVALTYTVPER